MSNCNLDKTILLEFERLLFLNSAYTTRFMSRHVSIQDLNNKST